MSRARDNANLGAQAGSGLDASDITTGALPVGVTGGSGLDALSASNLSAGVVPDARMPNLTGDITTVEGAVATSITADAVGTDELANDVSISTSGDITTTGSGKLTIAGDLVPSTPLSHRNMIINGAMNVSQRGTSFTGKLGANTSYTLDRWSTEWYNGSETAKATITRDALGTTDLPRVNEGLSYSYKIDCTTAIADQNANANNMETLDYRIEAQNLQHLRYGTSSAQTVCLSFWFKSPKSGIHCVTASQHDNGNECFIREFTIASADTWQKIAVTFPGDSSGVINNDTGTGLRLTWPLYTGNSKQGAKDSWRADSGFDFSTTSQQNLLDNTANNIYITGVQLELGSTATPFEHRSYGDELARCQRYLEIAGGDFSGRFYSTTACEGSATYRTTKRATPTISKYDSPKVHEQATGLRTFSAVSPQDLETTSAFYELTGTTSATAGNICWGRNAHLLVDAELL